MYVYSCNAILMIATKNRSEKEMIRAFQELTEDLKICGINPGFNFMDNYLSRGFKTTMITMYINYQLVPPSNHRENNTERAI